MMAGLTPSRVERWIADQEELAALATCDAVRAMHLDLASLHRAQLACLLLDVELAGVPDALDLAA